jgi:hypothetical protein
VVLAWGHNINEHGADVISLNLDSKVITLWDGKGRSASKKTGRIRIQGRSMTFRKTATRNAALEDADLLILESTFLDDIDPQIRVDARANLQNAQDLTVTIDPKGNIVGKR